MTPKTMAMKTVATMNQPILKRGLDISIPSLSGCRLDDVDLPAPFSDLW
ncbi:hypothetical protein V5E97_15150 [Singulisphaera sp. Ch08]|uniref:Uncharacterized protein n=1 Tax=Singulisphaera sp. Ch08 TaxID=3120278 RepID=A0AAU7CQK0_9BACT